MDIAVIGTGYVGLVAGACFADSGHRVICVDKDEKKISMLNNGQVPIYEPGLYDIIYRSKPRLTFTTDVDAAIESCQVIFSAVGTPEGPDGHPIMDFTYDVAKSVAEKAKDKKFLVLKSTVPIGTAKHIENLFKEAGQSHVEVVSNPEFLREGCAIDDFLNADRVVVGCKSEEARKALRLIYEPFVKSPDNILFMDNTSAEMTKYAANAFLATKISFINELSLLADRVGADIDEVRRGFTSDNRINPSFFRPGIGYGGSCFPKDVAAIIKKGESVDLPMNVIRSVHEANDLQKVALFERVQTYFKDLKGKQFAIWGLSFKPMTDDVREAPSLKLIERLVEAGARVKAFDPIAGAQAQAATKADFELCDSAMEATLDAEALIIVTEWNEFKKPDFVALKQNLKNPVIFDGRNIYNPISMNEHGFTYYCMGRQVYCPTPLS